MKVRGEGGAVLPLVLLLLLAATALTHGLLATGREELAVSRAARDLLQSRLAAVAGIRKAVAEWGPEDTLPALPWAAVPIADGSLAPSIGFTVTLKRLGREAGVLEAAGWVERKRGRTTRRVSRLIWRLDPATRLRTRRAVLTFGGDLTVAAASTIDGGSVTGPPGGWPPAPCTPYAAVLDSLFPVGALPAVAPLARDSSPGEWPVGTAPGIGLGQLDLSTLQGRTERVVEGAIAPAPSYVQGSCDLTAPLNWGSPSDPSGPCGDHSPLVFSPGAVTIHGGEGQGVLVVAGDLRLEDGARFVGLILVGGALTVGRGSRVEGLVQANGSVTLEEDALLRGSGCAVLRALEALPLLRLPIPLPHGSWIDRR